MPTRPAELSTTPVPVLSNSMIVQCRKAGVIEIEPFDSKLLAATAYGLRASSIRFAKYDEYGELLEQGCEKLDKVRPYRLKSMEHVVVAIGETIKVSEGFIADFFPASWCVEKGLILTAGRLNKGYERAIVFGLFNGSPCEVQLTPEVQLARASFGWLGSSNIPTYDGPPPGAYIEDIAKLRQTESALVDELNRVRLERERVTAQCDAK